MNKEAVDNHAKQLGLIWHEGKHGWAYPDDPESDPPRPLECPMIWQIRTKEQMDWFMKHNPPSAVGKKSKKMMTARIPWRACS